MWAYTGDQRPPFAETPATGQESVWDYPRPPKLVTDHRRIVVQRGDLLIADSRENYRILRDSRTADVLHSAAKCTSGTAEAVARRVYLRMERRRAVLDNPNRHIGAGGNCLELSKSASPIRHNLRVLLLLPRSNRVLRRWRASAPAARLFLWRLDNR